MEEECRKPTLTLFARNTEKEDEFAYKKEWKQNDTIIVPHESLQTELKYITSENFLSSLKQLSDIARNDLGSNKLSDFMSSVSEKYNEKTLDEDELRKTVDELFNLLDENKTTHQNSSLDGTRKTVIVIRKKWVNNLYSYASGNVILQDYSLARNLGQKDIRTELNEKFSSKYGYGFIPKILRYKNDEIKNDHLRTDYTNIGSSKFFSALFNSIDFDISSIKNAYETFQKQNNRGVLSQLENKINKKLKSVADKFNKLYFIEDAVYSFKINLESERIFFSLFRGEQTISLDYQSTGFKWFFNLFFNLLNSTNLNPGDIIIMDEPATNLHVKGQRELRGFLKEFAIHNDISIVIATHSPFLIDLDYLDEIRVVVNKDNISSIENNFAAVNENDPDSLLPIKDSLTVENHILVNPNEKVVFVEGITDYNYLTAFKKLFKKTGITFLPINGVGKTKEECGKIIQRLMKIRHKDPILLVDNDKAGNCIKEVNKDNKDFIIISLDEADGSFKTIESLFTQEDLEKFSLIDGEGKKHASTSSVFKNQILKNKNLISEKTKSNFLNLFDLIISKTE